MENQPQEHIKLQTNLCLDRINDSVIEETKNSKSGSQRKRSHEDETNIRSFHQASTSSSSSTPVHPISVPSVPYVPIHDSTELAISDTTELQRNDSATTDDNFDVWSSIVTFVDKYTTRE